MLTAREAFKVGFLANCGRLGMTLDEIEEFAKNASELVKQGYLQEVTKQAEIPILGQIGSGLSSAAKSIGNTASGLGTYGLATLLLAPPAIGAATGYSLGRLTDVDDEDVDSIKHQELIDEYLRNAERLRHRNRHYRSLRRV